MSLYVLSMLMGLLASDKWATSKRTSIFYWVIWAIAWQLALEADERW